MKVAVYCASSTLVSTENLELGFELGASLAKLGHELVWGGGASIMGTLSGGGKEVISIGKRTLLGANSGLGISLGDDCVLEAGVYLTAGSKVLLPDGKVVKARELSGANSLLIRRNSQSGALEALNKSGTWGGLNSVLHSN